MSKIPPNKQDLLSKKIRQKVNKTAGGVVVQLKTRKVLVVNQNSNSWSLPKGHIDRGENAIEAAIREIKEESGITHLILKKNLGKYERYRIGLKGGDDKSDLKRIYMFLFETDQVSLKPLDPHNPEAKWVLASEVEKLLTHKADKLFFKNFLKEYADIF